MIYTILVYAPYSFDPRRLLRVDRQSDDANRLDELMLVQEGELRELSAPVVVQSHARLSHILVSLFVLVEVRQGVEDVQEVHLRDQAVGQLEFQREFHERVQVHLARVAGIVLEVDVEHVLHYG